VAAGKIDAAEFGVIMRSLQSKARISSHLIKRQAAQQRCGGAGRM
jgi:hypothetical protein